MTQTQYNNQLSTEKKSIRDLDRPLTAYESAVLEFPYKGDDGDLHRVIRVLLIKMADSQKRISELEREIYNLQTQVDLQGDSDA
jgi:hypothetical protein